MDSESNVVPFVPKEIKEVVDYLGLSGVSINWLNSNPDSSKDPDDKNIRFPGTQPEVTADELVKFVLMNPSLANFFGLYIDPETSDMEREVAKESIDEDLEIGHVIDATDPEIWKKKSEL